MLAWLIIITVVGGLLFTWFLAYKAGASLDGFRSYWKKDDNDRYR